jgi:dTDP-4-dehydrorhamnose reductase
MSKTRVLVLGANGQVGRACSLQVSPALRELTDEVRCVGRNHVDLSQPDSLSSVMRDFKPHVVINAAAYTNVEKAEDEPGLADQVNGHSVGVLAELCKAAACLLVHYSTDYVFDGSAQRPYLETDPINPQSAYGRSKALGERFIREVDGPAVVLRTGWVFGRHGDNFYKKMLRFATQREELSVVDDQTGAPTPAEWLADLALHWALLQARGQDFPTGLFHAASLGQTTWHDYAALTFDLAANTPLLPRKPRLNRSKTAAMNFKAQRPAWSVLDTTLLQESLNITPPDWMQAVSAAVRHDIEASRQNPREGFST